MGNKKEIQDLLNMQFNTNKNASFNIMKEASWLIKAATKTASITAGNISEFSDYGILNSYKEELKIINKQLTGEGGIYSSNLIIHIPRDSNSVAFFNAFTSKTVLSKIIIVEIIDTSSGPGARQELTYDTCKVEKYNNLMDAIELEINYASREDKYYYYQDGVKKGQVVSSFSS